MARRAEPSWGPDGLDRITVELTPRALGLIALAVDRDWPQQSVTIEVAGRMRRVTCLRHTARWVQNFCENATNFGTFWAESRLPMRDLHALIAASAALREAINGGE